MEKKLFTSESVTEGHPDKIADQISDAILDAILSQDETARVACETIVNTGLVVVFGEITTTAKVDIQSVVRQTINEIGYNKPSYGFCGDDVAVMVALDRQSPDIAQGVNQAVETRDNEDSDQELGAGDQGLMFGYASDETESLMPAPIYWSHRLAERLAKVRKEGIIDYLGPDGKCQVTVEYDDQQVIKHIPTIVLSTQHQAGISHRQIEEDIKQHVILPVIPSQYMDQLTRFYINPTGQFVIGGPKGDAGLTGRKIIVDTYGGMGRHGGGAFSGKDATKVDRSASYMARYIAKNIVAAGFAHRCEVQLAYAIGVSQPVSLRVDTFNTASVDESILEKAVRECFRLTPKAIIERLQLRRPIYRQTAAYGHFGRALPDFTWEKTDAVNDLRAAVERLKNK